MDRDQRDAQEDLAVEVAKLKVRVAAEKAEPSRLLRQGIRSAPLTAVGAAVGVGALLALLRRRGARVTLEDLRSDLGTANVDPRSGVRGLATSILLELARRRFPELFQRGAG